MFFSVHSALLSNFIKRLFVIKIVLFCLFLSAVLHRHCQLELIKSMTTSKHVSLLFSILFQEEKHIDLK